MDDVLAALNQFRKEHFDLEPLEEMPKGKPRICGECPIARTLPVGWEVSSRVAFEAHGPAEKDKLLPGAVSRFVKEFDNGAYPELVER